MTRKVLYRTLVATLLLPNFPAYWWMLPRRMKRIRTQKDLLRQLMRRYQQRWIVREFERHSAMAEMIRSGNIEPIKPGDFRLPFQVIQR